MNTKKERKKNTRRNVRGREKPKLNQEQKWIEKKEERRKRKKIVFCMMLSGEREGAL